MWKALAIALLVLVNPAHAQKFAIFQTTLGGSSTCQTLGGAQCDANGFTILATPVGACEGGACAPSSGADGSACQNIGSTCSNGTRVIYVASGATACNGSPCTNVAGCGQFSGNPGVGPCLSPKFAATQMRNGSPDWLLLRCGDVWTAGIDSVNFSGLSDKYPMVFSSYDPNASHTLNVVPTPDPVTCSARPSLQTPQNGSWNPGPPGVSPFGATAPISHVAYIGLAGYAITRDPGSGSFTSADSNAVIAGASWSSSGMSGILVENCFLGFFTQGADVESLNSYALMSNIFFRRNQILGNYKTPTQPNSCCGGILFGGVNGLYLYENIFDHNSWNTCTSGQPGCGSNTVNVPPSIFSHNLYISGQGPNGNLQPGTAPTVTGNIFSNEAGGIAIRTGGFWNDNFFMLIGSTISGFNQPTATANLITNNVAVNAADTPVPVALLGPNPNARYVNDNMVVGSVTISGNAIVNSPNSPSGVGKGYVLDPGVNNNTVSGNLLYNWAINNPSAAVVQTLGALWASTGFLNITTPGSGYTDKTVTITGVASSNTGFSNGGYTWPPGGDGQDYVVFTISATGNQAQDVALYGPVYINAGGLTGTFQSTKGVNTASSADDGIIASLNAPVASACSASPLGCANGSYTNVALACTPSCGASGGQGGVGRATANITVAGGKVTVVTINSGGSSYLTTDVLTIADVTTIGGATGGNANFTVTPATFNASHILLYGTNCTTSCAGLSGALPATLYYPWYQTTLSGGSGSGASADIISAGTQIVAVWLPGSDANWPPGSLTTSAGSGYTNGNTINALPGATIGNRITTNGFNGNVAPSVAFGVTASVGVNTINANGCNLAGGQNNFDSTGSNPNGCTYTDPNRTAGSYYATLSGATANCTFTGSVASGTLTVSANNGCTLSLGDALTWVGQSGANYIKGNSSVNATLCSPNCTGTGTNNGTYALAGAQTIGAGTTISDWTATQLLALQKVVNKQNWVANNAQALRACTINNYIRAGFGMTSVPCPAQ